MADVTDAALRNAQRPAILVFFVLSATFCVFGRSLVLPDYPRQSRFFTCAQGLPTSAWCETTGLDLALTDALVPRGSLARVGLLSHLFTLAACPVVSLASVLAPLAPGTPGRPCAHAGQDAAIWSGTQLVTLGLNTLIKDATRRQRPYAHYGRQNDTEASTNFPGTGPWVSFYSGDTALAWSFVAAAAALASARRRAYAARLAQLGSALALVGSALRVVALMHWSTDVLVGILFGCLVGAGLPTLLFRPAGRPWAHEHELQQVPAARGRGLAALRPQKLVPELRSASRDALLSAEEVEAAEAAGE